MATRLAFRMQDFIARRSYNKWRISQQKRDLPDLSAISDQPILVSFVLSIAGAEIIEIEKTINSIKHLAANRWEIFIAHTTLDSYSDSIKPLAQEENIYLINLNKDNLCESISGDYVIFCQAGDGFFEDLLNHFQKYYHNQPDVDVYYYDCEYYDTEGKRWMPFFKPDEVSPALLLSTNMLSRSLINDEALRDIWSELDFEFDFEALEYDICLRLHENNMRFVHIPVMLLKQTSLVSSLPPINSQAISQHLARKNLQNISIDNNFDLPRFTWQTGDPSVAIIIPTRNNRRFLEPLLKSIAGSTSSKNFSINLVDNQTDDDDTLGFYHSIKQDEKIKIIHYDQPFNYSEAINLGAAQTDSDLILLMNDDMLIMNDVWLSELTQWAVRPEVGVVGAKLLRTNHTIQHAGIILGLTGFVGHLYLNAPEHYQGLLGSVDWYRNYLAVTGALQMISRDVFNELRGYDIGYQIAFGDIDFCLRAHEAGYQIIYTPYAKLFHYEGSSRGYQTPAKDALKGLDAFKQYLIGGDPYYNPNLTYTRIPKSQLENISIECRKRQIEERKRFYFMPENDEEY
jgi:GT2 family glycosyltransferase